MADEISPGTDKKDPFYIWRKDAATAKSLVLGEDADMATVQRVLEQGYGKNLTDDELITIGKDPFLIAGKERVVVTSETSKPKAQRKNRRIPNVCNDLGVRWITPFQLNVDLDFKTNWKKIGRLVRVVMLDRIFGVNVQVFPQNLNASNSVIY